MAGVPQHMTAVRRDRHGRPIPVVNMSTRLSAEARALLEESAADAGMSMSAYLEALVRIDAEQCLVERRPARNQAERLPLTG